MVIIMAHPIKHFRTITRHRHKVIANCARAGILRQGLIHDLSKYSPTEFIPGAKYFQGTRSPNEKERELYGYSQAWLHHKGRNRHHYEYWNDYNPKVPSKQEIKNTLEDTGYTKIHLEKVESQNTANTKKNVDKDIKDNTAKNKETSEDTSKNINTNESVSSIYIGDKCTLDLGAVGKGIACDVVQDYLKKQKEVSGAVIAVGGSILLYGSKADGSDWNVAVQNPRGQDGEAMGVLSLSDTTNVSTSGDYEKYFTQDGKRYHHILDPSTGYPADSGLISVTIVSDSGLLSDGLSTACFVLGKEKGEKLLETYGAEGVFIDQNKKVTVTKGLKDKFTILNKEYKQ